jgi:hypothetical protein
VPREENLQMLYWRHNISDQAFVMTIVIFRSSVLVDAARNRLCELQRPEGAVRAAKVGRAPFYWRS